MSIHEYATEGAPGTQADYALAAVRNESRQHRNISGELQVFNVCCSCGYRGATVSRNGDFEVHLAEATAWFAFQHGYRWGWNDRHNDLPHRKSEANPFPDPDASMPQYTPKETS